MGELGVGAVGNHAGLQPDSALIRRNSGQESRQPRSELHRLLRPAHEVGLGEAGREKVFPRGLIAQRAIAIVDIKTLRGITAKRKHLVSSATPAQSQTSPKEKAV